MTKSYRAAPQKRPSLSAKKENIRADALGLPDPDEARLEVVPQLRDALITLGLSQAAIDAFVEAAVVRATPLSKAVQRPKTKDFVELIEDRAWLALSFLDEFDILRASPKDKAVIAGILLEKRQLLRGEPTQILGVADRVELHRIMPLLVAEASKRGLEITLPQEHYREVEE